MKHTLKITLIMVLAFMLSQVIGLFTVNNYIDKEATYATGNVTWVSLPYNIERPPQEGGGNAVVLISIAILIGTVLVFLIIKFGAIWLWKTWFFVAAAACLAVAFNAFLNVYVAGILALAMAFFKIFRPNILAHNISELFIYGGLAAIFVPLFNDIQWSFLGIKGNLWWGIILLVVISIYDMIAVWKSKHMVTLAKFQTESKVFAGMMVPYKLIGKGVSRIASSKVANARKEKVKTAILGGGDIGFPLFFSGIVMQNLVLVDPVWIVFAKTLIISFCAALALLYLLLISEKDKFYPAMPFVSAGCLIGYGIIELIGFLA
jgi:presenilin-like A22 family membrane protease